MIKKTDIKAFNYMKAISAIGIIIYHYSCRIKSRDFLPLYTFKNGSWGGVFVTIFFMVSGALLYYNYSENFELKKFYIKRWIAIFPMFYLAYLSFWIGNVINNGSIFYKNVKWTYILSLCGMDGYFYENVTTYYILGEWFLGAIIILYMLFPVLLMSFKRKPILTFLVSLLLYIVHYEVAIINPHASRSIFSCLLSFVSGMLLVMYRERIFNKCITLFAGGMFIILLTVELGISDEIGFKLMGISIFCLIYKLCESINDNGICDKIIFEISKNSYAIFLLQHIAILKVVNSWNPKEMQKVIMLLVAVIIFIFCEAKILTFVTNGFVDGIKQYLIKADEK